MTDKIYRHGTPNKYDCAPFGTKCYVLVGNWIYEVYEQISHDENNPEWIYICKQKKEKETE